METEMDGWQICHHKVLAWFLVLNTDISQDIPHLVVQHFEFSRINDMAEVLIFESKNKKKTQ